MKDLIQPRVKRAINIFIEALENGTLSKGKCTTCAVGNLVLNGLGGTFRHINDKEIFPSKNNWAWGNVFITVDGDQTFDSFYFFGIAKENIEATEFTLEELMKIEYAFETNTEIETYNTPTKQEIREDQIKGLRAVVDVMLSFDDSPVNVDDVFTKRAEKVPV